MALNLQSKLTILADAAKYDASCASSGTKRSRKKGELGDSSGVGICHSYAPDGRCISLLKLLLTNYCIYDCLYCVNRISSDIPRARFTPDEVVRLTVEFYKRNYIEGLFLSSGIIKSPDYTAELLIAVAKKLRLEENFAGYIHLKATPGTSKEVLNNMTKYCDRISANIELPTEAGLEEIAPAKSHTQINETMSELLTSIRQRSDEVKTLKKAKKKYNRFVAKSQSTQMIVGATSASDRDILFKADSLYSKHKLNRVYYSGFSPIPHSSPILPSKPAPLLREHRLYQADWLKRFYNFKIEEIVSKDHPFLSLHADPKVMWAIRNRAFFPVDINKASKNELLRVPGFGTRTVFRILKARKFRSLTLDDLKKMRTALNRAKYFISTASLNPNLKFLEATSLKNILVKPKIEQLGLFDFSKEKKSAPTLIRNKRENVIEDTFLSSLTGQL